MYLIEAIDPGSPPPTQAYAGVYAGACAQAGASVRVRAGAHVPACVARMRSTNHAWHAMNMPSSHIRARAFPFNTQIPRHFCRIPRHFRQRDKHAKSLRKLRMFT